MPVFYNLNAVEKREVLVVILQIIRNLDDATLIKAWQQSIARTRLFFKLLEECITHFEVGSVIFFSFQNAESIAQYLLCSLIRYLIISHILHGKLC
jgi:hypothetical protein